jgi:ATP-dependent DNA helicase RecG
MIDFFPSDVMESLKLKFGSTFENLTEDERAALALAAIEGTVNHARLCTVSTRHPVDVSKMLQHLVQLGMLVSSGGGRGAVYHLLGSDIPTPDDVFGPVLPSPVGHQEQGGTTKQRSSSSGLTSSISGSHGRSSGFAPTRNDDGCLISEQLQLPMIDNIDMLAPALRSKLEQLAILPRTKSKVDKTELEKVLLAICDGHYLTLQSIAGLVDRKPVSLRNEYLSRMVRNRTLSLAFPSAPTHERQAYCSSVSLLPSES